jgi:DUF971 family protein
MLFVDKIINTANCGFMIKWSDGKTQRIKADFLQARCPCINCQDGKNKVQDDVKILSFILKAKMGMKVQFSSGCQKGIYSFNEIRSWLKNL